MQVQFKQWHCNVVKTQYFNQRTLIILLDSETLNPITKASVNLYDEPLNSDQVFIKNWSENEGILDVLVNAGIVEHTGKKVKTGFVEADLCRVIAEIPSM